MPRYKFTEKQKDNLSMWANWLDTTKLPQGQEALKRVEIDNDTDEIISAPKYCCLGLYVQYRGSAWFEETPTFNGEYRCPYTKGDPTSRFNTSFLPITLSKELGIYNNNVQGMPMKNNLQDIFAFLNDDCHYTFQEIAVEIRSLVDTGNFTSDTYTNLKNRGYA